ncbi:MAG: folate/biopterin family MFS transporter [Betaproteobacteria bacterium]|nr:folate/biopterin family MFS transporter [Betaproteobacteria bacterium]
MTGKFSNWWRENILELAREMRLSYLPPMMVYVAAGISGLTSIVGAFFVKDHLDLSAEFLAALGFWAGLPFAIKMPVGHIVDLIWRWKGLLVYLGASLIAVSLLIMVGLIGHREAMAAVMPVRAWYVLAALLSPIGYVIQDVVADAMTVEAVPKLDEAGQPIPEEQQKLMHTTMQTLGRVAIIGGTVLVALVNIYVFADTEGWSKADKAALYLKLYQWALVIPVVSVLGVVLASALKARERRRLRAAGASDAAIHAALDDRGEPTTPNGWILGGSLVFVAFTLSMGFSDFKFRQEIVFAGSMAIVIFLIAKLTRELAPDMRTTLVGTAAVIFMFRAVPEVGPGVSWWMIDILKFDEQFFSILGLIGNVLTLAGIFIFRRFIASHSIAYVVGFLALAFAVLSLPTLSMYHGLHEWTAAATGGMVTARTIAIVDTSLSAPLGQVAMIPMLAWIARSAPANLKATYFAVMASFTNLALSAAQLGSKYLNQIYTISREVRAPDGTLKVAQDYSQLGDLLIVALIPGLVLPFAAILFARYTRFRSA